MKNGNNTNWKDKHRIHREKNLIKKHLDEERDGLYRLKVIPSKREYKRKKILIKDISNYEEDIHIEE